jgi:teichuronic acid biosynthesis glycosyltransferase TuaG
MKLVSIILPMYNSELTIQRSINSVLKQSYEKVELILIDDFSVDGTVDIVENLLKSTEVCYKFIKNDKNYGVGYCRNTGILNSSGEFITFLDSDDEWHPKKIELQVQTFDKYKHTDLVFTSYLKVSNDNNSKVISQLGINFNFKSLLIANFIGNSTVMLRSSLVKKYQYPSIRKRQDYAFWLMLFKDDKINVYYLSEPLVKYFKTKNSLSSNLLTNFLYNVYAVNKFGKISFIKAIVIVSFQVIKKVL